MSPPLILTLDSSGTPNRWVSWQDAVTYEAKDLVDWSLGEVTFTFHGGKNRDSGEISSITTASIIAIKGKIGKTRRTHISPSLNNRALFRRDKHTCAYCGNTFSEDELTRDHIIPTSLGGPDIWTNVVTSCRRCNHKKGNHLNETIGYELLYVPYRPCRFEWLILSNRRILGDQMDFLSSSIKNEKSRWKSNH